MHILKFWVLAHNSEKLSDYCGLRYSIWDLTMSPSRQVRDLIIGCLEPECGTAIGAADCGASTANECHAVCGDAKGSSHKRGPTHRIVEIAHCVTAREPGVGWPCRLEQRSAADQIHSHGGFPGSARTPPVRPTRRRAGASPQDVSNNADFVGLSPHLLSIGLSP
jgi:hypothetical protein